MITLSADLQVADEPVLNVGQGNWLDWGTLEAIPRHFVLPANA
jgi:hypothetical protein